jgi:hypothetical protein
MPARHPDERPLVAVAAVSGLYDVALGTLLLAGRGLLTALFDVPAPAPPIHADLNGLFLLAVGLGYVLPFRSPDRYRGYLWVMGPFLKGLGCLTFLADHVVRHSPPAYLAFAVADGSLALITLWALWATRARRR